MFIWRLINSGMSPQETLLVVLVYILVISLAFSFHEFMHATVAYKLGDDTPYNMGRVTLNPMAHIDFMGLIMLILMGFGWGRPVVWNINRITKCKPRTAIILVSVAGVTGNFILALIAEVLGVVVLHFVSPAVIWYYLIQYFFYFLIEVNLGLLAFNLLPIPPLDGFKLIDELLPVKARYSNFYKKFVMYGPTILFVVIIIGSFANIPVFEWLLTIIEMPFRFLLGLAGSGLEMLMSKIG